MPRVKKVLAWHFTNGMHLRDGTPLEVGKTYRHKGDVVMCKSGYHASEQILDALGYASGEQVSRVELWGDVEIGDDKIVARNRRVLWTLDATLILHEFACRVAETALAKEDKPDPRSVAAIDAKRRWMRGEISGNELAVAAAAAWSAAADATAKAATWDAARAAAWSATKAAARAAAAAAWAADDDATARAAAWSTARAATWSAAGAAGAAGAAAWSAARAATWSAAGAARAAARAVSLEESNALLTQMIEDMFFGAPEKVE